MSLSITLTTEDTDKLIDTINLLDHIFSQLAPGHSLDIQLNSSVSACYTSEDISDLCSWYKNIVQVIRYNVYENSSIQDEEYLASLSV